MPKVELSRRAGASSSHPLVTVAICTRDDTGEQFERCLRSVLFVDYPNLDILVVDNAPDSTAERLVRTLRTVRYVRESRPGLERARKRAIRECRGEILAFVKDDTVVDHGWVKRVVGRALHGRIARERSGVWSSGLESIRDTLRSLAGRSVES